MLQDVTTITYGLLPALLIGFAGFCNPAGAAKYEVENLIADTQLHGANGMHFDADGKLIVGSMMSGTISRLDIDTGAIEIMVESPYGIADDLAIGPNGLMVWTAMPMGIVHALKPGGKVRKIADGLPLINSIYFTRDGRLFAAQVTENEGNLYELDPTGEQPPRIAMAALPGLNSFEITDDDILYGPLMHAGTVVRIDLRTMELTEIADGFTAPVAVNLDSEGRIYVVDMVTGELTRIDPETGAKRLVASLDPPIDNLAISDDDLIYVSHHCIRGIEEINPSTGAIRQVAVGSIGLPGSGILMEQDGRETLFIANLSCQVLIDTATGEVSLPPRRGELIWSSWLDRKEDVIVLSSFAFGQIQWLDARTGEPIRTLSGFANPYAIKLLPDDAVLLAEYGTGRILRLDPPYDNRSMIVAQDLGGPLGLALSNDGILYVTEATAGRVTAIDLANGQKTIVIKNLRQPEGIDILSDGRLVIAEVGAKRIIAVDTEDRADDSIEVLASNLPLGLPPIMGPPKTFLPTGVFAGRDGIIYVTADVTHTVLKLSPITASQ